MGCFFVQKLKLPDAVRAAVFLALCMAVLFVPAASDAKSLFVKAPAGKGKKNGSSWENACGEEELRVLLSAGKGCAESDDIIYVAKGVYAPGDLGGGRSAAFLLPKGVKVYGGFVGTETYEDHSSFIAKRDIKNHRTILTGDLGRDDTVSDGVTELISGDNSYHVVTFGSGAKESTLIDGFSITGGNANFADGKNNNRGGGMYISGSSPTVANCTFTGNRASYGGGMCNNGGSPTVVNCTFSDNSVGYGNLVGNGGGMSNENNSKPVIINCTFSGNRAKNRGGGVYNHCSSPTLTNCTFFGNQVAEDKTVASGGGMLNNNSSPTVTNCIFWGNSATDQDPQLTNAGTITYCIIEGGNSDIFSGAGNLFSDPLLSPLADNGGGTKTCALREGSAAIGAGAAVYKMGSLQKNSLAADQRGVTRSKDAPCIGAYEYVVCTITATAGAGGKITPSGSIAVEYGSSKQFDIEPDDGCEITDVKADGLSVGRVSVYEFKNVIKAHGITVTFKKKTEPAQGQAQAQGPKPETGPGPLPVFASGSASEPEPEQPEGISSVGDRPDKPDWASLPAPVLSSDIPVTPKDNSTAHMAAAKDSAESESALPGRSGCDSGFGGAAVCFALFALRAGFSKESCDIKDL